MGWALASADGDVDALGGQIKRIGSGIGHTGSSCLKPARDVGQDNRFHLLIRDTDPTFAKA